jgi:polyhydroxyalkanoate synthesis regulator protein
MNTTEIDAELTPNQDKNLDMVRNILFGEHIRENDKRLAMLERFVKVWTSSVRDEMRKNFDSLSHEIHLVSDLLAEESKARLGDTAIARKHFEQDSKGIDNLHKQLQAVQENVEQLRHDKADRKVLATLLDNVTRQLTGDTV